MKKILFLLPALMFIMAGLPAFSQKYKTTADTVNLNIEYAKVSSDIAELTTKLNKAQKDLPGYIKKADNASDDAQSTASETTDKASQATNGSVKDAKRAKREARRSVRDAKDSRNAKNNLDDQNKKIEKLNADLAKKQDRLKELDAMRASINNPK
jgi:chromosome segregation ATPase